MPWDSELCAAFYLDPPAEPEPEHWLDDRLRLLGVEQVARRRVLVGSPEDPLLDDDETSGAWAGLGVEVRDLHLGFFRAVTLVLSWEQLLGARRERGDDAFWAGFADVFAAACEQARPRAAFATDLPQSDVEELVAGREQHLLGFDAESLLDADVAVLYLSRGWFDDLDAALRGSRYERREVADGALLLAVGIGGT